MLDVTHPLAFDSARWEHLIAEAARRHSVPGIVAGALWVDPNTGAVRRFAASTGVTNTRTGVETTRDTLCQIGSITKVVTSVMIMQLCEEGKLTLDTPVAQIITDLELPESDVSKITVRHLLTHTSGIDGDVFTDTGRGDDCLEKYVAVLRETRALFAPDTGWSYCNSGFVLLGRIIELLDGQTWDASLQQRISARLDLRSFLTLPEDIIAHRSQHGHVRGKGQRDWVLAPVSSIVRSMGPAGLISSSVDDLLDFGAAFLRQGAGAGGVSLLSPESVALMTDTHVTLDPAADAAAPEWGLGWMLDRWGGHRVFWHGGTTIGNKAWLQVLPEQNLVFVVFCNGGEAPAAGAEIFGAFARDLAGIEPSAEPHPTGPASTAVLGDEWLGEYADVSTSLDVFRADDGAVHARIKRLLDPNDPGAETVELLPGDGPNRFAARPDALSPWSQIAFTLVDGRPCAYADIRCLRKLETAGSAA
ncbi:serine hydrolase domain-containing protein [Leucobacter albus]|uniref:Serine hydrolase domain-containing protein n=1 Tax=Leucobacter albus TaxID=272210 RepID=A0ABW3TQ29_9MICO